MDVKKYDLKKAGFYVAVITGLWLLVTNVIGFSQIRSCAVGTTGFFVIEGLLYLLLCFYCFWTWVQDKKGESTALGRFLQTIAKYEFLIEQLVSRDFKIKYKRSVLGVFWSFLNPLLTMVVQYVVFSNLLNVRDGGVEHYAIYLLCGIVVFNGFNDCCNQALRAITANASLITKVYVPKVIYPITKVFSASINIVLAMIPLLLVTIVYGLFNKLYLTWAVLLIPTALILLICFTIGMGLLLSSLMVFFHDVEFLWSVFSMMWMYGTPIIYSTSLLERNNARWLAQIMQFNPMYHYVTFMRTILIDGCSPSVREYLICILCSVVSLIIGLIVFHKTEDKFILYI